MCHRFIGICAAAAVALTCAHTASGQSFNINFSPAISGPSSDYAGVGLPGHWNNLTAAHGSTTHDLIDVDGNVTPANVWQFGGTELMATFDPDITGNDGLLMNSGLITYNDGLESCLFFHNMEPGDYEIIIYARMPGNDDILSYTSCDEEDGFPHYEVGGAWPGQHQEFVTYSRHTATVTTDLLRTHSGIVPGELEELGAAFNGIQIRKLRPCPADVANDDGEVDVSDLLALLGAWGTAGTGADIAHPLNVVDVSDLLELLSRWGTCSG